MSIEPDLVAFLRDNFRSMWTLELLLLLKADAVRCWRPEALVRELRASQFLVSDGLKALERAGLVIGDSDGAWRYSPPGDVLGQLCDRLEHAYRERPVTVVNIIAAAPPTVQSLADAFKLKGPR